jgi:uncharacterized protein DUF1761
MPQVHLNYLAVIVSAVVAFLIGGLWYSPILFAKMWVNAHGFDEEQVRQMQKSAVKAYTVSVICLILIALGMAVLAGYLHLWRTSQGLKLGVLVWACFAFPLALIARMYSPQRLTVLFIDTAYQLVYFLVMGAIIASWK